jgi:hypothetical protein
MTRLEIATSYFEIKTPTAFGGKEEILKTMDYLSLDGESYFVIGGATLVLRGIKRLTPDIDMLVSKDAFDQLANIDGAELHEPPLMAIARGADNKTVWIKNDSTPLPISATTTLGDGYYPMSFDSHQSETEIIDGINCVTLVRVIESKKAMQRPKDLEDLRAIARFLGEIIDLPRPIILPPYSES